MVLWVDKHRPAVLQDMTLHREVNERLASLAAASADVPHLLFYGPSGAGKATRVHAMLRELFGKGVERVRVQQRQFKANSKTVEISTIQSNWHIEMNPSEAGINDRLVIQEIIKELAQSNNVAALSANAHGGGGGGVSSSSTSSLSAVMDDEDGDDASDRHRASSVSSAPISSFFGGSSASSSSSLSSSSSSSSSSHVQFQIVVLNEVDRLTLLAQQALRRTMEKYANTCRLILVCESLSRVIAPLRSRCLPIRIPAPSAEEISDTLVAMAKKERIVCSKDLGLKLAAESGRNLRKAILMLEACKVKFPDMTTSDRDVKIRRADWEMFIDHIGKLICEEQSPERLLIVRAKFYELLGNCIPPEIILRTLTESLLRRVDDGIRHHLIQIAALYDARMHEGSKPIFHLEAFVAKFMSIYKRWLVEMFS